MNRTKEKIKTVYKPSQLELATPSSKIDELVTPYDSGMGLSMSDIDIQSNLLSEDLKSECHSFNKWSSSQLDSGCVFDSGLSIDIDEEELSSLNPEQVLEEHTSTTKTQPKFQTTSIKIDSNLYIYQDEDGDTILHLAVVNENSDIALEIISRCPYYLNILNNLYQSPLHLAVLTKQPKLVRRLVVAGADINLQDHRGNTPLHWVCSMGNYECLRPLTVPAIELELEQAGLLYRPSLGLYKFSPEVTRIRNYEGQTCMHLAAVWGPKMLEGLIQFGADINIRDGKSGQTPLHLCVQTQQPSTVAFLLNRCQASLNLKNYGRLIPLDLAKIILRYKPDDTTALTIVKLLKDEAKQRRHLVTGGLESQGEEEEEEEEMIESSSEDDETESDGD